MLFDKLLGGIGKEAATDKAAAVGKSAWESKKPEVTPEPEARPGMASGIGLGAAAANERAERDDPKGSVGGSAQAGASSVWAGTQAGAQFTAAGAQIGSGPLGNRKSIDMTKAPQCLELKEPTQVKSSLGNMLVYPDDFVGPLPKGAVRAADHERMLVTYTNIESGHSSISIDTSSFLQGKSFLSDPLGYLKAMKEAEDFRSQYMGYLRDLVKTPTGLTMLSELDTSKHKTKITTSQGQSNATASDDFDKGVLKPDGTRNEGTGSTVSVNPALKSFKNPGETEQPWMTERDRYGFYHELIHSYHGVRGDKADGMHNGTRNSEFQVVGLGPYQGEAVTENKIRREFDKELRPNYGGDTY
jgi:hypothetical protein